jgi:uncharacterized protein
MSDARPEPRRRLAWRPVVRSLHRDMGYLAVGLTLVYACSGLAVNHLADWDPNFTAFKAAHEFKTAFPGSDQEAARAILGKLGLKETPQEIYRAAPDQLEITLSARKIHANPLTGRVVEEGRKSRPFLRLANWLHLNRGKKAWTLFADFYAVGLLFLAASGMLMLPGKNGMRGRGAILVGLGIAVPVAYLLWSGGPGGG